MAKPAATTGIVFLLLTCAVLTSAQQAERQIVYRLSLPGKNWALDIPLVTMDGPYRSSNLPPLSVQANNLRPLFAIPTDGLDKAGGYFLMALQLFAKPRPSTLAHLVIRLKATDTSAGAAAFRALTLKDLAKETTLKSSSVKTWEHNQIPIARYTIMREHDDGNVYAGPIPRSDSGPRNMEAYFVKDGVGITLTLTASPFDADEEKLFYALVDSVKFVDTSIPSTSFDYYHKGRVLFMNKEYQKAKELLSVALSLEQRHRELDIADWRDLIQDLTDVYGATANRAEAIEVLKYAIGEDSPNTTFRMALARLYAATGDIDKTLVALEAAFSYMKKKLTPGMSLPDLNRDPAFKLFMKSERFRKAVKAMAN